VPVPKRPNMTLAVKRLIRDVAARVPELAHIRASRILVVAGEARRASRATIRPAHFKETRHRGSATDGRTKPLIRVKGRKMLYVITLRPLWFLSTPEERIATILHELYHASVRFDGTLHRGRRHERLPRSSYNRKIRRMRDRYVAAAPRELLAPFSFEGLARARMWLERPSGFLRAGRASRRVYTESQLFYGVVEMGAPAATKRTKG
jgi:predicted metallopeptidase